MAPDLEITHRAFQRGATARAKLMTSSAIKSRIWANLGTRHLPSSSNTLSAELMAAPSGVGQPRSACTISRKALKVLMAPGQPPAVAMQPTAGR